MTQIEWADPPPSPIAGTHPRRGEFFATLREHPGRWAKFPKPAGSSATQHQIKAGRYGGTVAGEFDATSRRRPDGKWDVYVRYVGGER